MSFHDFGLHPAIQSGVEAAGFTTPTPIQSQAIPSVLAGHDVLGLAQTGTGKTAAFVLPILQRLLTTKPTTQKGALPRAVIIAPTRELAEQIFQVIRQLGERTKIRSATIYGGVSMRPQLEKLKHGLDIIVACPGRLLDHMRAGSANLSAVEVLVLDEADQMFDMGFLPNLRQILKHLPKERQNLLFSATMPSEIRKLADEILHAPEVVQVGKQTTAETVAHALYPVHPQHKVELLLALLKNTDKESVLIFTRTKHRAKRLGQQLGRSGYRATSLQGNLSQNKRQEAMEGFRDGSYQILVATDIAARGIDVSSVSHVINFDIPNTPEAYTHRIGRTGRAAKTGTALTLITREDTSMVRTIERFIGKSIERRKLEGFNYDAPTPETARFDDREKQQRHSQPRRAERSSSRPSNQRNGDPRSKQRSPRGPVDQTSQHSREKQSHTTEAEPSRWSVESQRKSSNSQNQGRFGQGKGRRNRPNAQRAERVQANFS